MTDTQAMADAIVTDRLGLPLSEFIAERREQGDSWQTIAARLEERTDGVVSVSWLTVRNWSEEKAAS